MKIFLAVPIVCFILLFFTYFEYLNEFKRQFSFEYEELSETLESNELEDIDKIKFQLKNKKKKIFFIETSKTIRMLPNIMNSTKKRNFLVKLNTRQACAIESAAKMNPNTEIFMLFVGDNFYIDLSNQTILKSVLSYPNVHFYKLNLKTFVIDTPAQNWYMTGKIFDSKFLIAHMADFLRILVLWKFGGTYFDLDVIVLKNLENIIESYAGAESNNLVANGIMRFAENQFGHEIADLCLNKFQSNFNGNEWAHNGPEVITSVLQKICQTNFTQNMTSEHCNGFIVYPKDKFYAIGWNIWEYFFNEKHLNEVMEKIKDSLLVHFWNKLSENKQIKVGSNVAYGKLAEKYCPKVYGSCGKFF